MKHRKRNICAALAAIALLAGGLSSAEPADEQVEKEKPRQVLFTNVKVFDGVSKDLLENANVLVEGNLIKSVSTKSEDVILAPALSA